MLRESPPHDPACGPSRPARWGDEQGQRGAQDERPEHEHGPEPKNLRHGLSVCTPGRKRQTCGYSNLDEDLDRVLVPGQVAQHLLEVVEAVDRRRQELPEAARIASLR